MPPRRHTTRLRRGAAWTALALLVAGAEAPAAEGELDPAWNGTGKVRAAFDRGSDAAGKADHVSGLAVQADGKVLLFGTSNDDGDLTAAAIARVTTTGALDPGYDGDGRVVFGTFGATRTPVFALMPDGRVVLGAQTELGDAFFARRATSGASDPFPGSSFDVIAMTLPGVAGFEFAALLALPDGRFLAAGTATGTGGGVGTDFVVARFDANGARDAGFGTSQGYTRIDFALDGASADRAAGLARAVDGRIAVVGTVSASDREVGVAMLDADGQPLAAFDADGREVFDFDQGLVSEERGGAACFDPTGRLFVGATVTDAINTDAAGLLLVTSTGALDPGFGTGGRRRYSVFTRTRLGGVACLPEGRFLATGTIDHPSATLAPTEAFAARFEPDGDNDNSFGPSFGVVSFGLNAAGANGGREDRGVAIAVDPQGRAVAAFDAQFSGEDYDFAAARLTGPQLFSDGFE